MNFKFGEKMRTCLTSRRLDTDLRIVERYHFDVCECAFAVEQVGRAVPTSGVVVVGEGRSSRALCKGNVWVFGR